MYKKFYSLKADVFGAFYKRVVKNFWYQILRRKTQKIKKFKILKINLDFSRVLLMQW